MSALPTFSLTTHLPVGGQRVCYDVVIDALGRWGRSGNVVSLQATALSTFFGFVAAWRCLGRTQTDQQKDSALIMFGLLYFYNYISDTLFTAWNPTSKYS